MQPMIHKKCVGKIKLTNAFPEPNSEKSLFCYIFTLFRSSVIHYCLICQKGADSNSGPFKKIP